MSNIDEKSDDERGAPWRVDAERTDELDDAQVATEQATTATEAPPAVALYDTDGHGYGAVYGADEE